MRCVALKTGDSDLIFRQLLFPEINSYQSNKKESIKIKKKNQRHFLRGRLILSKSSRNRTYRGLKERAKGDGYEERKRESNVSATPDIFTLVTLQSRDERRGEKKKEGDSHRVRDISIFNMRR